MAGELTVSKGDLMQLAGKQGLEKMLKPLVREIHLFDTHIAGTAYIEDKTILESIKAGDKLILQREENKFDDKAILVLNSDKKKLGYIPKMDNLIFSRLLDAGKMLAAKINKIATRGPFKSIEISIYLIDF